MVYVGSQNGELHAVNLADGTPKWKYKASPDGIGESSPAVAGGLVLHRRSVGDRPRRRRGHRQGRVDVQDRRRSEIFAGRSRATSVLIGSYDSHLYALAAKTGKLAVEGEDRRIRPRHALDRRMASPTSRDATRSSAASASATARQLFTLSSGAYTGASPAILEWPRLLRHVRERGPRGRPEDAQDRLAVQASRSQLSVLLVGGAGRGPRLRRRPRQDAARARRGVRKGSLVVSDRRADRLVASAGIGGRGYVGSNDGKLYVFDAATGKARSAVRGGWTAVGVAGDRRGRLVIGSQDGKLFAWDKSIQCFD